MPGSPCSASTADDPRPRTPQSNSPSLLWCADATAARSPSLAARRAAARACCARRCATRAAPGPRGRAATRRERGSASRYPAGATRPAFRARARAARTAPARQSAQRSRRSPRCTATRRGRCSPSRRCRSATTCSARASTRANRSPTCGPSRRRSLRRSAWPTSRHLRSLAAARTARAAGRPALLPRLEQLGRAGRHLHEHAGGLRRHRGAARRTRRGEVLRRQRLGRDRAGAAVQADPRRVRARQRRGDHGVRDGRLADEPRTRLPGRAYRSPTRPKTPIATRSRRRRRPSSRCSSTSDAQRAVPAVRRDGLRMGAQLPAAAERPVRRPREPQGRGRTDAVELQPGHDDRRRHAALPGDRQRGLPLPGAPDGAGGARLLHAGTARRWRTRSSRRSTSATCCTSTRSRTTRPARRWRRPTSTTRGRTCVSATTCSSPARPPRRSCSCRPRSCRSTRCCPRPPSTYF